MRAALNEAVGALRSLGMSRVAVILIATLALTPSTAWACPVCFGAQDSPLAQAMNWAILALLAVTILVLGSFVKFFLYLNRTARQAREIEAEGSDAVFQSR